ncbi:MAG: 30S ribosomal protein S4 [Anaerolineae bacterium]|nr:30S ribosomal protein S4 [Anaerolineae bacterium]
MARYIGPVCKLCRREEEKLYLKGERCFGEKCALERRNYAPGMHGRKGQFRRKVSDYGLQLREKQKARRIYGVLEKQFRRYYEEALKRPGMTGATLLSILERRLDNVVYRLGFAESRAQARQLVRHGHFEVNGRKTNIPSMILRPGDVVAVRQSSYNNGYFSMVKELLAERKVVDWLSRDDNRLSGQVLSMPTREQIDVPLQEQLIVEYYSR